MRVLLQRVREAAVLVEGRPVARIGPGLLLLVGIARGDGEEELRWMARKVATLRIFEDEEGRFNRSLQDTGGEVLAVSQFTLYADARKGRRPSFVDAAPPEAAEPLCRRYAELLREEGLKVSEGVFGARMQVQLVNDGPVTLMLQREAARS
ncbi:MAG TPA: D-tyrosyl-tRNA(Tyr) deacylase [Bacteroidetes bacterium]|nr:D-tyrosyl-tRNA(Tyr) deacylase [Bacteroidota bacterium]